MLMKNVFRIYLLLFFLLSDFIAFAQPGSGGGDENPDEPGDGGTEPLPINSKLIWLALLGILFVYYKRNQMKKLAKNK